MTLPKLSIVTTVYNRADCLRSCIASVQNLQYRDYDHLIVADHPPPEDLARLESVVAEANDPRIVFFNLPQRTDNLGISPAEFGMRNAGGQYLAFLDDDNAFLPHHFDALIDCLEQNSEIGFAYSACLWNNEKILNDPVPALGRMDLGQILFRRDLFRSALGYTFNYSGYDWDWRMISDLINRGATWRFINQESFVFRLKSYPHLSPESPLAVRDRRIRELTGELARLEAEHVASQAELSVLAARYGELSATVRLIRSSTSWRLTAPLRSIFDLLRHRAWVDTLLKRVFH